MDRHQPHRLERLALDRSLALSRRAGAPLAGAPAHEPQEPAQVGPRHRLVLTRQAHQLAYVGEPPAPAGQGQHGEVVPGGGKRAVEQLLDRGARRDPPLPGKPAGKPREHVPIRDLVREPPGEQRPGIALRGARGGRQHHERVERDAHERRGQDRVERLLVPGVGQRPQVGDEVDHLRMRPVAPAADHIRRDSAALELALVGAQIAGRPRQQDDLRRPRPVVDELAHAGGERARLGQPPRRGQDFGGGPFRALVDHQQLDPRLAGRRIVSPGERRLEALSELAREGAPDHVEDLPPRAEVRPQRGARSLRRQALAALLEQLHVGVPEGVDRLVRVPDREQVASRDQVDQLELHGIGVLELVDHDPLEARPVATAQPAV